MSARYCLYCRCEKPAAGFTNIVDPKYRTTRGQCSDCTAKRRLPRATLEQRASDEREARKKVNSEAARAAAERNRKNGG